LRYAAGYAVFQTPLFIGENEMADEMTQAQRAYVAGAIGGDGIEERRAVMQAALNELGAELIRHEFIEEFHSLRDSINRASTSDEIEKASAGLEGFRKRVDDWKSKG
jgi:hypothetical protein